MNDRARHPVLIAALGLVLLAGVLAAGVSFGVSGLSVGHALQLLFFRMLRPKARSFGTSVCRGPCWPCSSEQTSRSLAC